jgi:predicted RNase H-like HicB family nuclease
MASERTYDVVLEPQAKDGYTAYVPDLPGCVSEGATKEEALAMIKEAIELYLESLHAHGDPVPEPVVRERVTVAA